jgi:hypothetical protein
MPPHLPRLMRQKLGELSNHFKYSKARVNRGIPNTEAAKYGFFQYIQCNK